MQGLPGESELGGRRQDVMHMCPECGGKQLFCRWCFGTGAIPEETLARWQREQDRIMESGG